MTTFLTSREMQELINVDRSTVYRMAEDGRLPGVKVGRQWRFPADRVAEQLGVSTLAAAVTSSPGTAPRSGPDAVDSAPLGLARLLQPEVAQSVADLVGEVFGVMAVITDMQGRPIVSVANPCGYYAAIADQPGAVEACLSQWQLFVAEPHVAPRWIRTHLGFLCARTFIRVDLPPVGMIVVGGVAPSNWPPPAAEIDAIAADLGVSSRMLDGVVDQIFHLELDDQRRILRLLPQMGDFVSQLASARQLAFRFGVPTDDGAVPTPSTDLDPQLTHS